MEKKKSGLWSYIKDILGYLIMTVFSLCIAIGMFNEGGSIGFILFAAAATVVGIYMIVTTLKKAATKDTYEPDAAYESGPWLREFDRAQKNMRRCPNCGTKLGRQEEYCFKCKSIIPAELDAPEELAEEDSSQ